MRKRIKWILLSLTMLLALVALWVTNNMARQIHASEQAKVKIWAGAIAQKSELVRHYDEFFKQVQVDEHRKINMYADILESFNDGNMGADMKFSLAYVNYIIDSSCTPIIITNKDSIITVPNELSGTKMSAELLQAFSRNTPIHYKLWGMPMTLYYRETEIYSDLRKVLTDFNNSYLNEITNNAVSVPVLIVDSTQRNVIESGNIDASEFNTAEKLSNKLQSMARANDPIRISIYNGQSAYVYFEDTPLLKMLRYLPVLYLFIAVVLLIVSYNLFRTAQSNEQNLIWVGLAKETAHQLGTPISSLMAWSDFLQGKPFEEPYVSEIKKDLDRLNTTALRFSKIGSRPELEPDDVTAAVRSTIAYLQPRVSRNVNFIINAPEAPVMVPLNRYLFEWVVENLCKNAIDAMNGKGLITATISHDNRYVYVDIADNGKGIPSHVQKHIFESGFTTKQRGWGLGLSLARRIIKEYHNGKIALKYSVEGQGTIFRITLNKNK